MFALEPPVCGLFGSFMVPLLHGLPVRIASELIVTVPILVTMFSMSKRRMIFMGTPNFAVPTLRAMIESQNVVAVVTQPDAPAGRGGQVAAPPVKRLALEHGIPVL